MSNGRFFKPTVSRTKLDDKAAQEWVDAIMIASLQNGVPANIAKALIDSLVSVYKDMHGYEPAIIRPLGF